MSTTCIRAVEWDVMDHLLAHKVAGVQDAIHAAHASLLYLPAHSPDLNPIEQVFAKLKALLRKAAARSKDVLWGTIGSLLDAFTPDECTNYLANCCYEPDQPRSVLGSRSSITNNFECGFFDKCSVSARKSRKCRKW